MATLKIDIAHDTEASDLCRIIQKFDLSFRSIMHIGPAGGNPYVEFTGTRENLEAFLKDIDQAVSLDFIED